jgi:hypothetical protein
VAQVRDVELRTAAGGISNVAHNTKRVAIGCIRALQMRAAARIQLGRTVRSIPAVAVFASNVRLAFNCIFCPQRMQLEYYAVR